MTRRVLPFPAAFTLGTVFVLGETLWLAAAPCRASEAVAGERSADAPSKRPAEADAAISEQDELPEPLVIATTAELGELYAKGFGMMGYPPPGERRCWARRTSSWRAEVSLNTQNRRTVSLPRWPSIHVPHWDRTQAGVIAVAHRFPQYSVNLSRDDGLNWDEGTAIDYPAWAMGCLLEVEPNVLLATYMNWEHKSQPLLAQLIRITPAGVRPIPGEGHPPRQ